MFAAVFFCSVLLVDMANAYVAIINKCDNTKIHVVPVPSKVKIDGKLDDWDMSGAILMYMDEGSKDKYSHRAMMMYGSDALYVAGHIKDTTPLINNHSFGGKVDFAWDADAVQLRLFSDPTHKSMYSSMGGGVKNMPKEEQKKICHITMWYSNIDKKSGFHIVYTLSFQDPQVNPDGVKGAYCKDADGKGYTYEYSIPYNVIRVPRPYRGGDKFQVQFQTHWGKSKGEGLRCGMTDLRNPAGFQDLGYHGPRNRSRGSKSEIA